MTVKLGLLALLEAKPGKGDELGAFLEAGRELAAAEDGTVTWYAFKITDTTYGIFDTFETEEARAGAPQRRHPRGARQGRRRPPGPRPRHPPAGRAGGEIGRLDLNARGTRRPYARPPDRTASSDRPPHRETFLHRGGIDPAAPRFRTACRDIVVQAIPTLSATSEAETTRDASDQ